MQEISVDLLLNLRLTGSSVIELDQCPMNKNKGHGDGSVDSIGNSTRSQQEVTTKKCRCGSISHLRTSHRDCPMNKGKTSGK